MAAYQRRTLSLYIEKPTRKTDKKNRQEKPIRKIQEGNRFGHFAMKRNLPFCNEAKSASEILELLGLKNKENLMENYLNPMLEAGMLAMTEPETPTNRNQKYKAVNPKA